MTSLLLLSLSLTAASTLDGNWKLSHSLTSGLDLTDCVIQLQTRDGRSTGRVLASSLLFSATAVESVRRDGDQIWLVLKGATGEQIFQGRISPSDGTVILGSLGNERELHLARLTRTEQTALDKNDRVPLRRALPEPMPQLATLPSIQAETAKLLEELVARHPDNPAVFAAGFRLLRSAALHKTPSQQVADCVKALARAAERYGRRWHHEFILQTAELLGAQPGYSALALDYARQAEKSLTAQDAVAQQSRAVKALAAAHLRAGQPAEAQQAMTRLAQLEQVLDKKYRAEFPPLQVPRVAGAERKGGRATVLEFFTGTHCRSCETSYLVFDALLKSYKPSDFILLQYHVQLAGPDPLANKDAEARHASYAGTYPKEFRTTPAILLDGKLESAAGHMSHAKKADLYQDARKKYNLYNDVLDQRLEIAPAAQVAVRAERQGDRIAIQVDVRGLPDPGEGKRLRVVLAEDTVRHVGGNNLRFHRRVVRAMPGGPNGVGLLKKDSDHQLSVHLTELREGLQRELDDHATRRPWPSANLPPALHDLWVIAFVQDEKTREILQGCQVHVP